MKAPRAVVVWLAAFCLLAALADIPPSRVWFGVGVFLVGVVAIVILMANWRR